MHIQLKLFDDPPLENYGWCPSIGRKALINKSFALENLKGGSLYCFLVEVTIKWMIEDEAIVESTDEWIKKLEWAGWKNPKKQWYRVKLKDLDEKL